MEQVSKSRADWLEQQMNKEKDPVRKEKLENMWTKAVMQSTGFSANAIRTNPEIQKLALTKGVDLKKWAEPILRQAKDAGRRTRKHRGGGLGPTSATWPPDNSSFGANIGSPVNTDNIQFEAKTGGKRRKTKKNTRKSRSLKRKSVQSLIQVSQNLITNIQQVGILVAE